jgi:uncharacterized protein
MPDTVWLVLAALGAGILNTLAGGGTFLTFPALVFTGVPPVAANATSAVAVFPGYLGGALGFRRELQTFDRRSLWRLVGILAGGLAGSLLLLVSSNEAFSVVVPFLLLAATLAFLLGDRIRAWAARNSRSIAPFGSAGLFATSIYGALGIVLLALFALWGMTNIHAMNGLRTGLSFALSAISVVTFAAAGIVAWPQAIIMMVAATLGGYLGAPIARALPKRVVQGIVAAVGFGMSLTFFLPLVV